MRCLTGEANVVKSLRTDEGRDILDNIRKLWQKFEPEPRRRRTL
jgi:hypothetical protein